MRVLVVEDDVRLCRAFATRLRAEGYAVDQAHTLAEARVAIADVAYDCLVLDRLLPDGDSIDLVAEVRARSSTPPVLVVSALGGPDDRLAGLRAGADDYRTKPIRLAELALRVRQLTVRATTHPEGAALPAGEVVGRLTLHRSLQEVRVDGEEVPLSPLQYRMLAHLVAHRDRTVTTVELLEACWDDHGSSGPQTSHVRECQAAMSLRWAQAVVSL